MKTNMSCIFRVDSEYKQLVNISYQAFLDLAQKLSPESSNPVPQHLTDHPKIAQLQDLYYLLKTGALQICEEKTQSGINQLILTIKSQAS